MTSTVGNPTDFASDLWKLPIAGVRVYVQGEIANAVTTAANGSFTLTNVPAGDVTLVVDGTTASNDPAGFAFPAMTFDLEVKAGAVNTVAEGLGLPAGTGAAASDPAVYLPRLATDTLTPVSGTAPTTAVSTPDSQFGVGPFAPAELSLTVQPNSVVGANGEPIANPEIGIAPVPVSVVQAALPPGQMQNSFVVSVEAPGATLFTGGASMTLPNMVGLAPGEQTIIFSLNAASGQPVVVGTATASANGQTVTTDPGTLISGPGLYGMTPAGSTGHGGVGDAAPGPGGAVYAGLVNTETQANQAALALVSGAVNSVGPAAGASGSALTFVNAAALGSDVAGAISAIGAELADDQRRPDGAGRLRDTGRGRVARRGEYRGRSRRRGAGARRPVGGRPVGSWGDRSQHGHRVLPGNGRPRSPRCAPTRTPLPRPIRPAGR